MAGVPKLRRKMRVHTLEKLIFVFFAVFWLVTGALGQTASTGAVVGVVVDPSGALVPGATVRLERIDAVRSRSVETDQNGQFGLLLIPPGTYFLKATKNGFGPSVVPNLKIFVT